MKTFAYIACVFLGILIGISVGAVSGFKAKEFVNFWAEPDIHLSSKEIIKRMEGNGLTVPSDAYDLEYFYQSSPTDWRKMVGFSSDESSLLQTIKSFTERNPIEHSYESENKEYFPWPSGPSWWPRDFEKATIYTGENYSLAHDKKNHRFYLLFYTL